jgi:hypothetical protein
VPTRHAQFASQAHALSGRANAHTGKGIRIRIGRWSN